MGFAMTLKPFALICRPIGCVDAPRHRPDFAPTYRRFLLGYQSLLFFRNVGVRRLFLCSRHAHLGSCRENRERSLFIPSVQVLTPPPLGFHIGRVVVGFVYPAYASYKALESKTPESSAQWLTYWCVFSIFTVVEFFADLLISTVPLYYLAKLLFVVWLMAPRTKGATTLYVRFIMPVIKKHEESIDNALAQGYKKSENTFIDLKRRGLAFLREKGIYSGGSSPSGGTAAAPPAESKATV